MELVWADQGYTGAFAQWLEHERGWRLEKDHERLPATSEAVI